MHGWPLFMCNQTMASQMALVVKNPPANAGDTPGSERSPGVGNGNLLQYSCLKNSMDRGAQHATVHGVEKSQTCLRVCACAHTCAHTHTHTHTHKPWLGSHCQSVPIYIENSCFFLSCKIIMNSIRKNFCSPPF